MVHIVKRARSRPGGRESALRERSALFTTSQQAGPPSGPPFSPPPRRPVPRTHPVPLSAGGRLSYLIAAGTAVLAFVLVAVQFRSRLARRSAEAADAQ